MIAEQKRPTGVTMLGILAMIVGILCIFGGLGLVAIGVLVTVFEEEFELPFAQAETFGSPNIPPELLVLVILGLGALLLGLGIALIFAAYGTLDGKAWAWPFDVVLALIFIVTTAASTVFGDSETTGLVIGAAFIAFYAVIIYYLYRPHVKAFYDRLPATAMSS